MLRHQWGHRCYVIDGVLKSKYTIMILYCYIPLLVPDELELWICFFCRRFSKFSPKWIDSYEFVLWRRADRRRICPTLLRYYLCPVVIIWQTMSWTMSPCHEPWHHWLMRYTLLIWIHRGKCHEPSHEPCHHVINHVTMSWTMPTMSWTMSLCHEPCHHVMNHVTMSWTMSPCHELCHHVMNHVTLWHKTMPWNLSNFLNKI